MFTLRFDMRAPHTPTTDLYGAAIDMCAWAETRGAVLTVLSEHHGTADGHLAAPASYRHGDDTVASISHADTVSALRRDGGAYQILSIDEAAGYARGGRPLPLLPLCGGLPPEVAWPYLERAVAASERDRKQ